VIDKPDLSRLPLTAKWLGYIEPAWKHLRLPCCRRPSAQLGTSAADSPAP
jgi:hypothetical protein